MLIGPWDPGTGRQVGDGARWGVWVLHPHVRTLTPTWCCEELGLLGGGRVTRWPREQDQGPYK